MNKPAKIFILYAKFGDGHWQAANALRQSFARHGADDIRLIDLLAEAHPFINEVSRFVYHKSYNALPQVYGWVYDATKGMKADSLFAHWLHSFGAMKLLKLLELERPDAVVHTFPILVLPSVAKRINRKIPMFNVVTDFDLHRRWVHPEVDKYYVATEDLGKQLCDMGVSLNRVAATGIPLRPGFSPGRHGTTAATRFGLDAGKRTVLIMAGAYGVMPGTEQLCKKVAELDGVQAAVVCGRNAPLAAHLQKFFAHHSNIAVHGYVEQIDELMGLSDCIVTKPGGLTLSEAILARLPIFLYRPVPGQERNNARYLESKGAAVICHSPKALKIAIEAVLTAPGRMAAMRDALGALRQERSSDRIALDILRQLNIMEEASVPPVRV